MTVPPQTDALLIDRIRGGDEPAWGELIERYEGRLLAFVESRLGRRGPSEDIVQETFLGFLNSLPNFDGKRPLELHSTKSSSPQSETTWLSSSARKWPAR